MTFDDFKNYILNDMRMSQVYQPAMLRTLLERGGSATAADIAREPLSYDQSQLEYYEIRTKQMVGRVLTNNGVVEPIKEGKRIVGYWTCPVFVPSQVPLSRPI